MLGVGLLLDKRGWLLISIYLIATIDFHASVLLKELIQYWLCLIYPDIY